MSNSLTLYRPSILDLARNGNFRAIAIWINSLLGPYGIYIRVFPSKSGHLNILIDFKQPRRREFYMGLRKHLVRFICYRLWTLNSERIRDVRIAARITGEPDILWKQSVRIVTPANRESLRQPKHGRSLRKGVAWFKFQVLRSTMMSRLAVAGFFLCYWLLYWELAGKHTSEQSLAAMTSSTIGIEQTIQVDNGQAASKGQLRSASTEQGASEGSLAQLGKGIESQLAIARAAEQFQGKEVYEVKPANGEKVVALTFDDGPWEGTTEQVLDILKQNDIKATFFWVGQALQKNPEIAQKVVADGHAIGNHTWQHLMDDVDQATATQEINSTAQLIYETTGVKTNLFRPPGGNLTGQMAPYARGQNDIITMWSVESQDYYVSAPIIVDNVLSKVQPGSIVLMHDGGGDRSETVKALPQIISALKRQGYQFVTLPQLLATHAEDQPSPSPLQPPTDPSLFNPGSTSGSNQPGNPPSSPATAPDASPYPTTDRGATESPPVSPSSVPTGVGEPSSPSPVMPGSPEISPSPTNSDLTNVGEKRSPAGESTAPSDTQDLNANFNVLADLPISQTNADSPN